MKPQSSRRKVRKAKPKPGLPPATDPEALRAELAEETSTWAPVALGPILAGKRGANPPSMLPREDGVCLLYRAKVHSLYGEPEAGKGWVAMAAVKAELLAERHVLYIDFEDDPETAVERLRDLGVPDEAIEERFHYLRPEEPMDREELAKHVKPDPSLVVIDGMTEGLALENIEINDNTKVANWIMDLPRWIAYRTAAAVLIIDHVAKSEDSRFAIGAQHKLAGIHVALQIKPVNPFGRGLDGSSRIQLEKDRFGHLRRHEVGTTMKVLAEVQFKSGEDGAVTVELGHPNPKQWKPTEVMKEVADELAFQKKAGQDKRNRSELVRALRRKEDTVDAAIHELHRDGYIKVESLGEGRPTLHSLIKPYRQDGEESPEPPPKSRAEVPTPKRSGGGRRRSSRKGSKSA